MVTRYDLLLKLKEQGLFASLVASSIITLKTATWFMLYEKYLEELKTNIKPIAVQFAADDNGVSERNMYRVIAFMENTETEKAQ